jgi:hypothetical protein
MRLVILQCAERNLHFYQGLPNLKGQNQKKLIEDYNLAWKERNTNIKFSLTLFCALGEYAKLRNKLENCPISLIFGRNKKN